MAPTPPWLLDLRDIYSINGLEVEANIQTTPAELHLRLIPNASLLNMCCKSTNLLHHYKDEQEHYVSNALAYVIVFSV
eukprot:4560657-Heterocapsa_arctica.AAC.1